ncbi:MAG: hypothetical protein AAFN51_10795 [Pseudomonadota bacterium]
MGRARKITLILCLCIAVVFGAFATRILSGDMPGDVAGNAIAGGLAVLSLGICIGAMVVAALVAVWSQPELRLCLVVLLVLAGLVITIWVNTDGLRILPFG